MPPSAVESLAGPVASAPPAPSRTWVRGGAVLAAWLALGFLIGFHPALRHGWRLPLENYPDTRLMTFVLEHDHRCLATDPSASCLFRPPFFFPFADSGALTEIQLGILPFYSPWRWLGASPYSAALLAQALQSIVLFGLCALLLRSTLGATALEAGFGALLVAFGSPKLAQIYHLQLFAQVPLFLALLVAARLLSGAPSRRRALWGGPALALLLAFQAYSCLYVLVLAGLLLLASTPALALFADERAVIAAWLRQGRLGGLAALLLALALVWPLGARYLAAARGVTPVSTAQLSALLPTPLALLNPGDRSWLGRPLAAWTGVPELPYSWELSLGVGLAVTLLVLIGIPTALRRPWLRALWLGAAMVWLIVLRWPGEVSLWKLLVEQVPALAFLRALSRLQLLMLPLLAATAILGLRAVRRRCGAFAALLLVALAVAEQPRDWGLREAPVSPTVESVAARIPRDCDAFFLSAIGPQPRPYQTHLTAMWAALATGVPTLNGYSGYRPRGWRLGAAAEVSVGAGDLGRRLDDWLTRTGFAGELCWLRTAADGDGEPIPVERRQRTGAAPPHASPPP